MRRWLRRYAEVNLTSGPLVRVWIEAIEGPLRQDRAAVTDWGRRRMATMLQARGLGDVDIEAEILMAIVEVFGSRTRTKAELDACLMLIERASWVRARGTEPTTEVGETWQAESSRAAREHPRRRLVRRRPDDDAEDA